MSMNKRQVFDEVFIRSAVQFAAAMEDRGEGNPGWAFAAVTQARALAVAAAEQDGYDAQARYEVT